jgi:hypothetical protein
MQDGKTKVGLEEKPTKPQSVPLEKTEARDRSTGKQERSDSSRAGPYNGSDTKNEHDVMHVADDAMHINDDDVINVADDVISVKDE